MNSQAVQSPPPRLAAEWGSLRQPLGVVAASMGMVQAVAGVDCLTGVEVAAKLQEIPALKHIPIIFLTAIVSNAETHGRETSIGGHDFLAKPVAVATLTSAIAAHLK